jgi:hypothetical protein
VLTSMARDRDAAPDQARDQRPPAAVRRSSARTGGRSPEAEVRSRAWMRWSGSATKQLRAPPTTRTSTSIPPPLLMAAAFSPAASPLPCPPFLASSSLSSLRDDPQFGQIKSTRFKWPQAKYNFLISFSKQKTKSNMHFL